MRSHVARLHISLANLARAFTSGRDKVIEVHLREHDWIAPRYDRLNFHSRALSVPRPNYDVVVMILDGGITLNNLGKATSVTDVPGSLGREFHVLTEFWQYVYMPLRLILAPGIRNHIFDLSAMNATNSDVVASPIASEPVLPETDTGVEDVLGQLSLGRRTPFPGVVDPGMAGQGASERNTEFWFSTIDEAEDNARTRSVIYQTMYVVVVQTAVPSSKPYGSMTVAVAKSAVPKVNHYFATFNNGQRISL